MYTAPIVKNLAILVAKFPMKEGHFSPAYMGKRGAYLPAIMGKRGEWSMPILKSFTKDVIESMPRGLWVWDGLVNIYNSNAAPTYYTFEGDWRLMSEIETMLVSENKAVFSGKELSDLVF